MKFVFCEGGDDLAVIRGVANKIELTDLRVEEFGGKDKLRKFLRGVQMRPEFSQEKVSAIAIIRDADDDGDAAFQSVCDSLRANGLEAPAKNCEFTSGHLKVGVFVIGPKGGKGMVEDLCLNSVSERPEFSCIDDYFRCIAEKSDRKHFSSKAKIRVWMASHEDYGAHVGVAATKGYWPWDNQAFDSLKKFLQQLASL